MSDDETPAEETPASGDPGPETPAGDSGKETAAPETPNAEPPGSDARAEDAGTEIPDGDASKAPARKVRTRRQKILRRTALGAAALLLVTGAGGAGLYYDLMGDIEQKDPTGKLGDDRPEKLNKSLNILLIGSDSRAGDNSEYAVPGMSGARSDTAILLHLSPNRDQAVGVSFPRDSMVEIPECEKDDGGTVRGRFGMLNSAFAFGGPLCTWKTLESLTGVHIDHFVQIDFAGFKKMVNALGGVEICVEKPVNDPRAELYLKAGRQTVKGDDALGYVRARYSLGNGSDLGRIERQQKFMAAMVDKATSGEVLTDPAKTYKFLKAATGSITTDKDFDLPDMRKLAEGLRGMSAGQVRFVTVPVERYKPDPNRVRWNPKQAGRLFQAIRHDDTLPAEPAKPAGPQQALPQPGQVTVTVIDAGADGKAVRRTVKQLKDRGFKVAKKVRKAPDRPDSRITYAPSAEGKASALAKVIPNAALTPDGKGPRDSVHLVIGKSGVRLTPSVIKKVGGGIKPGKKVCD